MGRAKKGQLKDTPVDELLHALFKVGLLVQCRSDGSLSEKVCPYWS